MRPRKDEGKLTRQKITRCVGKTGYIDIEIEDDPGLKPSDTFGILRGCSLEEAEENFSVSAGERDDTVGRKVKSKRKKLQAGIRKTASEREGERGKPYLSHSRCQ